MRICSSSQMHLMHHVALKPRPVTRVIIDYDALLSHIKTINLIHKLDDALINWYGLNNRRVFYYLDKNMQIYARNVISNFTGLKIMYNMLMIQPLRHSCKCVSIIKICDLIAIQRQ